MLHCSVVRMTFTLVSKFYCLSFIQICEVREGAWNYTVVRGTEYSSLSGHLAPCLSPTHSSWLLTKRHLLVNRVTIIWPWHWKTFDLNIQCEDYCSEIICFLYQVCSSNINLFNIIRACFLFSETRRFSDDWVPHGIEVLVLDIQGTNKKLILSIFTCMYVYENHLQSFSFNWKEDTVLWFV